jgi:hypothetical protein
MTASRNSKTPWFAAICSLLLGACASNAPPVKTPSGESATSPSSDSSSTKPSAKADAVEGDESDEVTAPAKAAAGDTKEKRTADKGDKAPVDDSRTTESIRKIINDNRATFKKCYEDERKKAPDLKGTVVLELTMDADGKLTSSGVDAEESTIKVRAVTDCIVKVAQGLKYPPSSKGLDKDFRYQFGFNNH